MKTFIFAGKVIPEESAITIEINQLLELEGFDEPSSGRLRVSILNSLIRAELETDDETDLPTIRSSIESLIQGMVDSLGYYMGSALDVRLTYASGPEGGFTFSPKAPFLEKEQHKRPLPPDKLLPLAVNRPRLLRALGELRNALRYPIDTTFYCYRAIEAMRHQFADSSIENEKTRKKESWNKMGVCLRFSESFKKQMEEKAQFTRHGDIKSMTGNEIEDILARVWEIMDRFIVYLDNEEVPLGSEYELLA